MLKKLANKRKNGGNRQSGLGPVGLSLGVATGQGLEQIIHVEPGVVG